MAHVVEFNLEYMRSRGGKPTSSVRVEGEQGSTFEVTSEGDTLVVIVTRKTE